LKIILTIFFLFALNVSFGFGSSTTHVTPFALDKVIDYNEYVFKSWDVSDGLPVNAIIDINQDSRGYLWLTTYEGLVRFDGSRFKVYNTANTPELKSNRFSGAYKNSEDPSILWFISEYGGIVRLQNDEFTFFGSELGFTEATAYKPLKWNNKLIVAALDGLYEFDKLDNIFRKLEFKDDFDIQGFIQGIVTDGQGNLFVITSQNVFVLDEQLKPKIYKYKDTDLLLTRFILAGELVFGINEHGVFKLIENGTLEKISINPTHQFSTFGATGNENFLFVSSSTGFSKLDLGDNFKETFVEHNFKLTGNISRFASKTSEGMLFTTLRGQLLLISDTAVTSISASGLPRNAYIINHFIDEFGKLWLATGTHGLFRMQKASVQNIDLLRIDQWEAVIGIFEDNDHNLYFNIRGGGTYKVNASNSLIEQIGKEGTQFPFEIYTFAQTNDGTIYAGINRVGIATFNQDMKFDILDLNFNHSDIEIRSMVVAPDDTIWLGVSGELYKLKSGELVPFTHSDFFRGIRIQKMVIDANGGLWIATARNGVIYLNGELLKNYTVEDGLANRSVRGIYIDKDDPNVIWFATEGGGLSRFKDGQFQNLNTTHGLHRDLLHNITEDNFGRLWMNTNRGVFYVYKEKVNEFFDGKRNRIVSKVFQENEGMRNAEGNGGFQNSFINRSDGTLMFATQGGIAVFDTNLIISESFQARAIIENISWIENNKVKKKDFPKNIILNAGQNDFTIYFTGIEYNAPELIEFRYKLEGYDKDWIEAGKHQRMVSYTNLRPQTYTFNLITNYSEQNLSDKDSIVSLIITIKPLFYQTIWFYMLVFLGVIMLVYLGYAYRLEKYRLRDEELTRKVHERTMELHAEKEAAVEKQRIIEQQALHLKELNTIKDKFFSIIAHDLRGPFAGVFGFIEMLKDGWDKIPDHQVKEMLIMMHQSGYQYKKLLENLLLWARIQFDTYKADITPVNVAALVEETVQQISLSAQKKNISLKVHGEEFVLKTDENMLNTILRNIATNAVKFSYEGSEIEIRYFKNNDLAVFEIQDFGTGMSQSQLKSLFNLERTKSTSGTASEKGTGLGLVLSKEMADQLNGKIEVKSEINKGTTFSLLLPDNL